MAARGTVAVGDVANAAWVAPILVDSALRGGTMFCEAYAARAADAEPVLAEAEQRLAALRRLEVDGRFEAALTPHAPHTSSPALLRAIAARAARDRTRLSVHVAESEAEVRYLADGSGPLAELFEERGRPPGEWQPPACSPVRHLERLGLLGPRTLAVHCVHVGEEDRELLRRAGASVVTCPRSNRYLGVGTAPVPELLRAGIAVALGTDSLASAPDLDLFAEMAALRREHPGLDPETVLRMATHYGARALGCAERLGSIEAGREACFVSVALAASERAPLEAVTSGAVAGVRVGP
jgi:cytosine/adenosine deaminase-related metal-dependent hydrolase